MATVHLVGSKHGWGLDADERVNLRVRLGHWLRRAREARGLTVAAVAAETKIPQRHLEALERGDTMELPPFYQRAEIRTVAHAVGVDERVALARLQAALAPVEPRATSEAQPAAAHRTLHTMGAVAAGAFTVALLGWGILDSAGAGESRGTTVHRPAATPATPVALAPAQAARAAAPAEHAAAPPVMEEPPPAGTPTELVITTRPEGARVTVNGVGWGVSPVTIRHLPPGDKRIRATKDGYGAGERALTIDEGSRQAVRIQLTEDGL